MKKDVAVESIVKEWIENMPKGVRDLLFVEKCTLQIEGYEEGDRNVTHWRYRRVEVVVDDGSDEKLILSF
jgi:hypothetical protein